MNGRFVVAFNVILSLLLIPSLGYSSPAQCRNIFSRIEGALSDIPLKGITLKDQEKLRIISQKFEKNHFGKAPSLFQNLDPADRKRYLVISEVEFDLYSAAGRNPEQLEALQNAYDSLSIKKGYLANFGSDHYRLPLIVLDVKGSQVVRKVGRKRLNFFETETRLNLQNRLGLSYRFEDDKEHNATVYVKEYLNGEKERVAVLFLDSDSLRLRIFEKDRDMRWQLIGEGFSNKEVEP